MHHTSHLTKAGKIVVFQVGKSKNQQVFTVTHHATYYKSTQIYLRLSWLRANFRTKFDKFPFEKRQRYVEILIYIISYLSFSRAHRV